MHFPSVFKTSFTCYMFIYSRMKTRLNPLVGVDQPDRIWLEYCEYRLNDLEFGLFFVLTLSTKIVPTGT